MRVLMKIQMGPSANPVGNGAGPPPFLAEMMERLHPEAAYFYPENGKRTSILVFDLESPADMPTIGEPIGRALGDVAIDWSPCMDLADLRSGLSRVAERRAVPA